MGRDYGGKDGSQNLLPTFYERRTIIDLIFIYYNTRLQKEIAKDGMVANMFFTSFKPGFLSWINRTSTGKQSSSFIQKFRILRG